MALNVGRLFTFAWHHARAVPEPVLRVAFTVGADIAWARRGSGVRQLERNLRRVCPEYDERALRRLSRVGMRSYLRYYQEAFTLPAATAEQIAARVRVVGEQNLAPYLGQDTSPVLALAHLGNWDLAGAFATPHLARVLTVAERLEPPELFAEFVAFRQSLGMEILPLGDPGTFRALLRAAGGPGRIIPLLADRDLTAHGIEVDLYGYRARVAAGPGLLAVSTKAPVVPTAVYYERLSGAHRRAAGTPWGIVIDFLPAVHVPEGGTRSEQVAVVTQGWVDALSLSIRSHPQDWHMLQKVFITDLDPERYATTIAAAEST